MTDDLKQISEQPSVRGPSAPIVLRRKPMILITGGSGFLGANLADRLAAADERVLIFDDLSRPGVTQNLDWLRARHGRRIETMIADVRDEAALREAMSRASAVFHMAAQVAVTSSINDPISDFEINARGTLNVLEAARRRADPPPLLLASTNKVYGEAFVPTRLVEREQRYAPPPDEPSAVDECWPLDLCSPYGCSKGVADQYVLDYARVYGLRTVVLRMSCIYGPRQFGTEDQGWVAHFLIRALQGQPITIYGDGKQVRDLLYVGDAVDAYLRARARIGVLAGQACNLGGGSGNAVSLLELLARLPALGVARPPIHFADWRPGDQLYYVSDTAKLEQQTGWRARTSIAAGLRRLQRWLLTSGIARVGRTTPRIEEVSA